MPAIGRSGTKPKSLVEHLSDQAPKRAVNDIVSLDRYLMSAQLLLKQAADYRNIGDEEQLYVMLLRFASLVVETIPTHRDFQDSNSSYKSLKKDLLLIYLPELERLKVSLRLKDRPEPPAATSRNRPSDAVQLTFSALPQLDWASSGAPLPKTPAAAPAAPAQPGVGSRSTQGSGDLKVDDLLEVMAAVPATAPPPAVAQLPPATVAPTDPYALAAAAAAAASGLSSSSTLEVPQPKYASSNSPYSSGRHALFAATSPAGTGVGSRGASWAEQQQQQQQRGPAVAAGARPRYPVLDTASALPPPPPRVPAMASAGELSTSPGQMEQLQQQMAMVTLQPSAGPSLGPQEIPVAHLSASTQGLPDTCLAAHQLGPSAPHLLLPPTQQQQTSLPSESAPTASSGGLKEIRKLAQLRDVHVSVALMEEFLHYARSNTSRGIESCGILAGRLLAGDSTFAINTLIIPKQQGTSDTVQALNEEEIFDAQFSRELYPLGWIHTHPTQTCFLSSIDVHTQCGYQTMLAEAVAIVMAPTDATKKCGIFRLSTPGGLSLVQKCPQRGFHMHPPTDTGQELYELCGHVFLNPRTKHEVLDLR